MPSLERLEVRDRPAKRTAQIAVETSSPAPFAGLRAYEGSNAVLEDRRFGVALSFEHCSFSRSVLVFTWLFCRGLNAGCGDSEASPTCGGWRLCAGPLSPPGCRHAQGRSRSRDEPLYLQWAPIVDAFANCRRRARCSMGQDCTPSAAMRATSQIVHGGCFAVMERRLPAPSGFRTCDSREQPFQQDDREEPQISI